MAREIKFRLRTWNENEYKKYWSWEWMIFDCDRNCCDWNAILSDHQEFLMQYTWLKDKNGVDIYEGDLVEASEWDQRIGMFVVVYHQSAFVLIPKGEYNNWKYTVYGKKAVSITKKVVGNIYENKDLLLSSNNQ